jgi:hypothetical protein
MAAFRTTHVRTAPPRRRCAPRRVRASLVLLVLAMAALLSACPEPVFTDAGTDAQDAGESPPGTFAEAVCAAQQRCDPLFLRRFADRAGCVASIDTGVGDDEVACIEQLAELPCDSLGVEDLGRFGAVTFHPSRWPEVARTACAPFFAAGDRANGTGCSSGRECSSGDCDRFAPGAVGQCGVCQPTGVGAACALGAQSSSGCPPELMCSPATRTCVQPAIVGDICSATAAPCLAPAQCIDDVCRYARTDEPCEMPEINREEVRCQVGFTCINTPDNAPRCQPLAPVASGAPCAFTAQCPVDHACWDPGGPTVLQRRCMPLRGVGGRCEELTPNGSNTTSSRCLPGLTCRLEIGGRQHCGEPPEEDLCENGGYYCPGDLFDEVYCDQENNTCRPMRDEGETCTTHRACRGYLRCADGVCVRSREAGLCLDVEDP